MTRRTTIARVVSLAIGAAGAIGLSPLHGYAQQAVSPDRQANIAAEAEARRKLVVESGNPFRASLPDGGVQIREVRGGPVVTLGPTEFEAELRARYSDVTVIIGDNVHGWQVEYTSPDGKAFLWYPGNTRLVVGTWRTRFDERAFGGQTSRDLKICFRYEAAYNPATGAGSGDEECQSAILVYMPFGSSERKSGDPFGLATGKMPYKRDAKDKPPWPSSAVLAK